jgi:hypothetical protein
MDQILAPLVPAKTFNVSRVFLGGTLLAALDAMMKAGHVRTTLSRWSIKKPTRMTLAGCFGDEFRCFGEE